MIEVITDKKEWSEQLALAENLDLYHTFDYHHLSKTKDESAVLLKYTEGNTTLVLPLLLRPIKNSDYKDATSVYGYAGLLAINIGEQFKKDNFHKALNAYFNDNKIISVFSRLHPFIEHQEELHNGLGKIVSLGKVVYINLTDAIEVQRARYNRRLKTYINKARKLCTVFEGTVEEHLDTFINLYEDNMKRVDATEEYFFDKDYYHRLLSSTDFETQLILCRYNETQEIIAGALFMKTGNIVQYHLSGLSDDYFELNPIKLIIDEVRITSTNEGYKIFNLGGGLGSEEDSLFKFKSGFSKDFETFKIWKYIVDEDAYKTLTKNHLGTEIKTEDLNTGFFPAYRAPLKAHSV
ncbi:peptidoglycan bridge formation glycyltransferase FemA/FemB family protein [Winogradskyella schleiferi]|uniref:peptidoglycan bridge formation glycyltransferase FemA/FemB family protein n=1 Tax=Winogradskyella schleiferi TaxID=2686078 RepID=UPI0015BA4174|nr:peptidoglycan bridge formation glycyltransferase FemA/FemB family protein [Winogradskyella schleiferi]